MAEKLNTRELLNNKCVCDLRICMQTFTDRVYSYVPEVPGSNRRLCKSDWSIHVVNVGIYTVESSLNPKLQHGGNRSATGVIAPSPVLSPSNILPPSSSHWAFVAAKKQIRRASQKLCLLLFPSSFCPFLNFFFTPKLRDLKFRNSGSVCTSLVALLPKIGIPGEN